MTDRRHAIVSASGSLYAGTVDGKPLWLDDAGRPALFATEADAERRARDLPDARVVCLRRSS